MNSQNNSCSKFAKIYTMLIVLYPIISMYWSGISSLSVADLLLILSIIKCLVDIIGKGWIKITKTWGFWGAFTALHFFVTCCFFDETTDEFFTFLRFFAYVFSIAIMIPNYFNRDLGLVYLRVSGVLVALFCLIQAGGIYVLGIYIKGYIPFLPIMREDLARYGQSYTSGVLRVRGVFAEPAFLATYFALVLTVTLFTKTRKKYLWAVLETIAMIFSVSTTAYAMLLLIWGIYFVLFLRQTDQHTKNNLILTALVFLGAIVVISFVLRSELFVLFKYRFQTESFSGRMNSYAIFEDDSISGIGRIIGNGYADYKYYLPSIPFIYWRYGNLGLIIIAALYLWNFIVNKGVVNKLILLVFAILCIGTQAFVSYTVLFYMAFVGEYELLTFEQGALKEIDERRNQKCYS